VIIAHPACNLQHVRLAFHEPAEADALDAAAYNEFSCLNFFVGHTFQSFKISKFQNNLTSETLKL
jgi:hypothetical protein